MTHHHRTLPAIAALFLLTGSLGGCTTNPATGASEFTPLMSPSKEREVGAEQHPKLLVEFGGVYDEKPELNAYITAIGERLHRVSEMPKTKFTFTIVNSDTVNAFALPGGYVYVTRGLMALANSEAEVAGVMAHEVGHVTARHTAKRYNRAVLTTLGAAVLGAAVGAEAGQIAQLGAAAYVQGYSRDQEFESDQLGVRYLARAGYDPRGMSDFLATLQANSKLAAKIAGRDGKEPQSSLFSSHPRTPERVKRAAEAARGSSATQFEIGRDAYLFRIDGMIYGDDPAHGIRRRQEFIHPELGFRFEVPPGFRMHNSAKALIAVHKNGAMIRFDAAKVKPAMSMRRYVSDKWLKDVTIDRIEEIDINGMAAATARARIKTRDGKRDIRAIAIRFAGKTVYRFLIVTPTKVTAKLAEGMQRMTFSFRRISEAEAAAVTPLRIRIHEVAPGETVATLAARLPFDDFQVKRFRVLNGLGKDDELEPGQLIKLIVE
jgi:predicted Zn-dependent protease